MMQSLGETMVVIFTPWWLYLRHGGLNSSVLLVSLGSLKKKNFPLAGLSLVELQSQTLRKAEGDGYFFNLLRP